MGLNKNSNGNGGYTIVQVKHGGFSLEWKFGNDNPSPAEIGEAEQAGYSMRLVHNPSLDKDEPRWLSIFPELTGVITDVQWYDTKDEFTTRFTGVKVKVEDDGETFMLDLPYGKRVLDAFLRFAENIDFSKPIEFRAWKDRKSDATAFMAKQDGEKVPQKYTKDYIESGATDCPPATENKRAGTWNFDAQREWLLENLLNNVVPKLQQQVSTPPAYTGTPANTVSEHATPLPRGKAKAAVSKSSSVVEDKWGDGEGPDPIHD
jgi:hypothetical protein